MQSIQTKYIGPTNRRGSRIKATAIGGHSITVSYDDSLGSDQNHDIAAIALCHKLNWKGALMRGWANSGNVYGFVSDKDCLLIPDKKVVSHVQEAKQALAGVTSLEEREAIKDQLESRWDKEAK